MLLLDGELCQPFGQLLPAVGQVGGQFLLGLLGSGRDLLAYGLSGRHGLFNPQRNLLADRLTRRDRALETFGQGVGTAYFRVPFVGVEPGLDDPVALTHFLQDLGGNLGRRPQLTGFLADLSGPGPPSIEHPVGPGLGLAGLTLPLAEEGLGLGPTRIHILAPLLDGFTHRRGNLPQIARRLAGLLDLPLE